MNIMTKMKVVFVVIVAAGWIKTGPVQKQCIRVQINTCIELELAKPSVYGSIGRRAFSYAAPQIWNDIPLNIRISPSVSSFKCNCKTHYYFAAAF